MGQTAFTTGKQINTIADLGPIEIPTSGSAGIVIEMTAGATISIGEIVAPNGSGQAVLASGDSLGTGPAIGIAVSSSTSGNPIDVLILGYIYQASHGFTVGDVLYAATTDGDLTTTAPTGTGDFVQIIGYAKTSDVLYIAPELNRIEVA